MGDLDTLDFETRWIVAKAEYAEEAAAFHKVRLGMPARKELRSLSQRADYEYAKMQFSKASKRLEEERIRYKSWLQGIEEQCESTPTPEQQKAKYGNVPEHLAKSILDAIEKGRRKA